MKKNRMNRIRRLRIWGIFCCLVWMGTADLWATQPADPERATLMERWKERPHSIQFGYGLVHSAYYTSHSSKPLLSRFMLDYAFDLPWKHTRTNFFVTGDVAYTGDLSNNRHYSLDRFHISAGIGFNIHLAYFLNLSMAYSPGFYYDENLLCSSPVNAGNHRYRTKAILYGYRALCSIRLTGEVKNIRIGIGFEETHCFLFMDQDFFLSLSIGYRF